MTREYQINVPELLSTILSLVVARAFESESIDSYSLAREESNSPTLAPDSNLDQALHLMDVEGIARFL
jgi:hypothetical protein